MDWLEAGLAFAVVMMVLSTVVTVVIETVHRAFNIREQGLRRLMEHIYSEVIAPGRELGEQGASSGEFVEQMTCTRFLPVDKQATGIKSLLSRILNARQLKKLTTLEFVERLAETPAGRSLVSTAQGQGRDYLRTQLKYLASKFEDFGQDATEYFARRTSLMSVLVAMALAFSMNVNAVHLFQTLLIDTDLRQDWIDRGEKVAEELQREIEQSINANQEAIKEKLEQLSDTAASLKSSGIPIGWESAPWHGVGWQTAGIPTRSWLLFQWSLSVILAGLLIGLGGPFWFDIFRKLSSFTGVVRGLQTPVQQAAEPGQAQEPERKRIDGRVLVDIFETAAAANSPPF